MFIAFAFGVFLRLRIKDETVIEEVPLVRPSVLFAIATESDNILLVGADTVGEPSWIISRNFVFLEDGPYERITGGFKLAYVIVDRWSLTPIHHELRVI